VLAGRSRGLTVDIRVGPRCGLLVVKLGVLIEELCDLVADDRGHVACARRLVLILSQPGQSGAQDGQPLTAAGALGLELLDPIGERAEQLVSIPTQPWRVHRYAALARASGSRSAIVGLRRVAPVETSWYRSVGPTPAEDKHRVAIRPL
jgi:hypothetical protein